MSQPEPPVLTVRSDNSQRTFAPGHDVVIGRDLRADVRVGHPLVSRSHVVLRYDRGRWVAIDNGSLNGMFVDNRRVPTVDIRDGQTINIGNPDGPQLTFEVGKHIGSVGRPPQTASVRIPQPPSAPRQTPQQPAPPRPQVYPPSSPHMPSAPPAPSSPHMPSAPPAPSSPHMPSGPQAPSSPHMPSGPQAPSGPQPVQAPIGQQPQIYSPPAYPQAPGGVQPQHPGAQPPGGAPPQAQSGPQAVRPPTAAPPVAPPAAQPESPPVSVPAAPPAAPAYDPSATQLRRVPSGKSDATPLGTAVFRILRPGAAAPPPDGGITIGRAVDNDIVIPDVLASRHHATLVQTDQGVEIRDASSINGTFVNGTRVKEQLLANGNVVTIGNIDLVFNGTTLMRRTESEAASTKTGGLEVRGITLTIDQGKTLLDEISFAARTGTLTAVIGPSGAGKSTLAGVIVGATNPTKGTVTFEGHNIHAEYASLRSRIGMVPQDDVVHRQLTVDRALGYAAELRLPPDTTKTDRREVMGQVLDELELTAHAEKRVDKLSGGQRKRASVAMELLTGPSLLILDEPTSGLDPALDRQVMTMLRQLADAGRVVVVVTHSLTYLDVCDQVLLLAPGGKTAFCGPPGEIGPAMGTTNWADIFTKVGENPDEVHRIFKERAAPPPAPDETVKPAELGAAVHTSLWRQFSTIARRQVRLLVADRGYFIFLLFLPFIMGVLCGSVPGTTGTAAFGVQNPNTPTEAGQILVMLNVGAIFMGTALTIRDLIGERPIFRREQAVGLSTSAYLLAKLCVYGTAAVMQAAIATAIALLIKGRPQHGGVLLHNFASMELFVTVAACTVAAAVVGLALSALARSSEQIMPLLVVAIMSQLVFSGGMIPVTSRTVLDQLSWVTPARWGYASSASTVDLTQLRMAVIGPNGQPVIGPDGQPETIAAKYVNDIHWHHTLHGSGGHWYEGWLFDMAMLGVIILAYSTFVRWRIRLKSG